CFWLVGSSVSAPSISVDFDGLAKYNTAGYQAPLLRFRGNTCMSSPLALPSTREIKPGGSMPEAAQTGFTALLNPYLDGMQLDNNYMRPIINGSFRPVLNGQSMFCSS